MNPRIFIQEQPFLNKNKQYFGYKDMAALPR